MQLIHHDAIPSLSYGLDNLEKVCHRTKFYHDRSVFLALLFLEKIINFIFYRKICVNLSPFLPHFLYAHHPQTVSSSELTRLSLSRFFRSPAEVIDCIIYISFSSSTFTKLSLCVFLSLFCHVEAFLFGIHKVTAHALHSLLTVLTVTAFFIVYPFILLNGCLGVKQYQLSNISLQLGNLGSYMFVFFCIPVFPFMDTHSSLSFFRSMIIYLYN